MHRDFYTITGRQTHAHTHRHTLTHNNFDVNFFKKIENNAVVSIHKKESKRNRKSFQTTHETSPYAILLGKKEQWIGRFRLLWS